MRFVSIFFLCVLAGCSWRSEQKLTYVPFSAQIQQPVKAQQTPAVLGQRNGGTCPCQCAIPMAQNQYVMPQTVQNTAFQPAQETFPQAIQQPTQPVLQQQPSADYLLPKEDVYPTQPSVIEAPIQPSDQIVILQHPVQRDLVKCSFADLRCISGYELQGYVQLSRTPMVPVSVEQNYDVLDGKWSNSSNVPRW